MIKTLDGLFMKIGVRHIVALCLGVFLIKIVIFDAYRDSQVNRAPATVRTINPY